MTTTTTTTDPRTLRLLEKLIWTALDQGGNDNEKNVAAQKAFALCRGKGIDAKAFFALFGGTFSYKAEGPQVPMACKVRMPFGKFKGRTLGAVAEAQLSYLDWLLDNCDLRTSLEDAIRKTREHYTK